MKINPFKKEDIEAVKRFNNRLKQEGVEHEFPESNQSRWFPKNDNKTTYEEYYLAADDQEVRGGYILKRQNFFLNGEEILLADYRLPLSEGIINKTYNFLGIQLLRNALKNESRLYCLGMGGFNQPLPKMLKSFKWRMFAVPFHFKIVKPFCFLKQIQFLRKSKIRKMFIDISIYSGIGWAGIKLFQLINTRSKLKKLKVCIVSEFGDWADDLWNKCRDKYFFIGNRNKSTLNHSYQEGQFEVTRLKVSKLGEVIGWAVVLNTKMDNNDYFGSMKVGTIADCLALPEYANEIVQAACEFLENSGADLIVSNQSHYVWSDAFKKSGFISGPSNFIFAVSDHLSRILDPFEKNENKIFINRGDGDGPINL